MVETINMKECGKCKLLKPLSEYYKQSATKNKLNLYCKDCERERLKLWYEKNKVKIKEKQKNYYLKNEKKIHKKNRLWYEKNEEKMKEYQKKYRKEHKENFKNYDKTYHNKEQRNYERQLTEEEMKNEK